MATKFNRFRCININILFNYFRRFIMGWLDATNNIEELQSLNNSSPYIKILTVEGIDGGKLINDRLLEGLDYLNHFAPFLLSLQSTNEFPKPIIPKKRNI